MNVYWLYIIMILFLFLIRCDRTDTTAPGFPDGRMTAASGCKQTSINVDPKATQECIRFTFERNTILEIQHINSGMNCCSGSVFATVRIDGDSIVIREYEGTDAMPCDCLCLYDFDYEITGLEKTEYILNIQCPLAEPFECRLDLKNLRTGLLCIDRNRYPWSEES